MIEQLLGARIVFDPGKTVVLTQEAQAGGLHLVGQPFAAVQTDLDGEREPALQPGSAEAELGVHPVLIQMQAFARAGPQQQASGLAVGAEAKTPADFDCREQTDQAAANTVAFRDRARQLFLALLPRGQVEDRTFLRDSRGLARLLEPFADLHDMLAEILEQNVVRVQISLHALGAADGA